MKFCKQFRQVRIFAKDRKKNLMNIQTCLECASINIIYGKVERLSKLRFDSDKIRDIRRSKTIQIRNSENACDTKNQTGATMINRDKSILFIKSIFKLYSMLKNRIWIASRQHGYIASRRLTCCLDCGAVWTELNAEDRKEISGLMIKDVSVSDCKKCGSIKRIAGQIFRWESNSGKRFSVFFKPKHLKRFSLWGFDHWAELEKTSICCTNCGLICTRLNHTILKKFILKNCALEYGG